LENNCSLNISNNDYNSQDIGLNKPVDSFEFPLGINDTVFTLTVNKSIYKSGVITIVSKMVVFNELKYINLDDISRVLSGMKIEQLNIFSINSQLESINTIKTNKGSRVMYLDMNVEQFVKLLNYNGNFSDYNKNSLYILRGGNYIDIKNLFTAIGGYPVNLGRGGSQKSHMLSPLDLRLSSYLMAMYNFDYELINNLNTFNYISKNRYLS
jgi:hypothetical protein